MTPVEPNEFAELFIKVELVTLPLLQIIIQEVD